jgi:hypothetical protein
MSSQIRFEAMAWISRKCRDSFSADIENCEQPKSGQPVGTVQNNATSSGDKSPISLIGFTRNTQ